MEEQERREKSQALHKESQKQYDRQQNALCFVVLGAIALIIGIVFIFLSFKREYNVLTGIDTGSIAFVICILMLSIGAISLAFGLTKFFLALSKQKKIIQEINQLK